MIKWYNNIVTFYCLLLFALLACTGGEQKPYVASDPSVDSIFGAVNDRAALFKNKDWKTWCTIYLDAYDLVFSRDDSLHQYTDKIPLLDSVIAYENSYQDSASLTLLREAYYNRAYDLDDELSEYGAAQHDFEKVIFVAQKVGFRDLPQESKTINRLANICNRLGDTRRCLQLRRQQFELVRTTNDNNLLVPAYINLGILQQGLGNTGDAITTYSEGLKLKSLNYFQKAKLLSAFGGALAETGKTDSAFTLAKESMDLLRDLAQERDTLAWLATNYLTLAKVYARKNDSAATVEIFAKALEATIKGEGRYRVREVGKVFLTLCEPGNIKKTDIRNIQQALYTVTDIDTTNIFSLPRKADLYAENTIMEALDAKAEWMRTYYLPGDEMKYRQCAIDCYDLAFEVERKLLANFSYDESKIHMLRESRLRSEKAIGLCHQLFRETGNAAWISTAFRFAELNKAFIVLESIKRNLAVSAMEASDTLLQQVQQYQFEYTYAESALLTARNTNDTSELEQLEKNQEKTAARLQIVKSALYQSNDGYRQLMEKEDSFSLTASVNRLPSAKMVLVEYFIGDSASWAFVAGKNFPARFIRISNDDEGIDSLLFFFRDKNAILNDPGGYQAAAYNTYQHWLKPCFEGIDKKELLLIPDDKLSIVPFDALITSISTSNNLRDWNYLLKDHTINYAYSLATFLQQKSNTNDASGMIAFAPGFDGNERGLDPLPYTSGEVSGIGNKASLYTKQQATIANFRKQAGNARFIHIASHASAGKTDDISRIEFIDSSLYENELYAMRLRADLVVLSACETGIGKIEEGEGPMSLARGFYYAGAKNIITSLWNINDRSTALLFTDFYTNAKNGGYAGALRQSKLNYLQSSLSNDKYSPYYWASLVCISSAQTIEDSKNNYILWICIAGFFLTTACIYFYVRNKRNGGIA